MQVTAGSSNEFRPRSPVNIINVAHDDPEHLLRHGDPEPSGSVGNQNSVRVPTMDITTSMKLLLNKIEIHQQIL